MMPRVPRAFSVSIASAFLLSAVGVTPEVVGQQSPGFYAARVPFMEETPVFGAAGQMAFDRFLRERLRQPVTLRFEETPLRDVVAEVERQVRIPMAIDLRALEDAGLDGDIPVTLQCMQLAARDALDLMLSTIDLSWYSKHHLLLITTKEKVDEYLMVRVYPVVDLVSVYGDAGLQYQPIIDLIQSVVAPETWDTVGGQGAVRVSDPAMALVISQTRDVHDEIEEVLLAIRETRQAQGLSTLSVMDGLRQEAQSILAAQEVPEMSHSEVSYELDSGPVATSAVPPWQRPRIHE